MFRTPAPRVPLLLDCEVAGMYTAHLMANKPNPLKSETWIRIDVPKETLSRIDAIPGNRTALILELLDTGLPVIEKELGLRKAGLLKAVKPVAARAKLRLKGAQSSPAKSKTAAKASKPKAEKKPKAARKPRAKKTAIEVDTSGELN